jgi:hypothetical protein
VVKILITGFRHSGTTMLLSLLRNHPQVGWIEMEEGYIEFNKPREWVLQMASKKVPDLKNMAWGEKIPWGHRPNDQNANRVIGFTKKWLKYFGKQSRVLHILRHPIDTASSGRPDEQPGVDTLKHIMNTVPAYINFINNSMYCATIVYEDLLINPREHLKNIYHFCGLKSNDKILNRVLNAPLKFGKINADRAYAFMKKGIAPTIDYQDIVEQLHIRL